MTARFVLLFLLGALAYAISPRIPRGLLVPQATLPAWQAAWLATALALAALALAALVAPGRLRRWVARRRRLRRQGPRALLGLLGVLVACELVLPLLLAIASREAGLPYPGLELAQLLALATGTLVVAAASGQRGVGLLLGALGLATLLVTRQLCACSALAPALYLATVLATPALARLRPTRTRAAALLLAALILAIAPPSPLAEWTHKDGDWYGQYSIRGSTAAWLRVDGDRAVYYELPLVDIDRRTPTALLRPHAHARFRRTLLLYPIPAFWRWNGDDVIAPTPVVRGRDRPHEARVALLQPR